MVANRLALAGSTAALVLIFISSAWSQSTAPQGNDLGTPMQRTPTGGAAGSPTLKSDAEFVQRAAVANQFEILQGELAVKLAIDPALKAFGAKMVRDHGAALNELRQAATADKIPLPAEIRLDEAHQTKVDSLKIRKADFDQAFFTDQAQAHREAVALLDAYRTTGTSEGLRAWATKALEGVHAHQKDLQAMGAR